MANFVSFTPLPENPNKFHQLRYTKAYDKWCKSKQMWVHMLIGEANLENIHGGNNSIWPLPFHVHLQTHQAVKFQ